jgi:uncharacterized protein
MPDMSTLTPPSGNGTTTVHWRAASIFFVLAFLITWAVWLPRAWGAEWAKELGRAWTYGPAMAAVVASLFTGGRSGLRELGARIVRWRIGIGWYAVVILGPMVMALVESGINLVLIGGSWGERLPTVFTDPLGTSFLLLFILTLTDGLGEEVGWRGFALPRMLAKDNAMMASVVLGLLWAAWHVPLFWTDGSALADSSVWALFARLPAAAVIYTWLFRHTRGSVLAVALFHGALNLFAFAPPPSGESMVAALTSLGVNWFIALTLITLAGWKRLDRWPGRWSAEEASSPSPERMVR